MQIDLASGTRSAWPRWAEFLHGHRLENLTAWVLEAAGPLTVFGAQMLYIGGPFLRPAVSRDQCEGLAALLEDRDELRAFTTFLRGDGQP